MTAIVTITKVSAQLRELETIGGEELVAPIAGDPPMMRPMLLQMAMSPWRAAVRVARALLGRQTAPACSGC